MQLSFNLSMTNKSLSSPSHLVLNEFFVTRLQLANAPPHTFTPGINMHPRCPYQDPFTIRSHTASSSPPANISSREEFEFSFHPLPCVSALSLPDFLYGHVAFDFVFFVALFVFFLIVHLLHFYMF